MNIPKELKFQGRSITIKICPQETPEMKGYNGRLLYDQELIFLCDQMSKDLTGRILLEEIIHLILREFNQQEKDDETLVQTLASALYAILKDNKLKFE